MINKEKNVMIVDQQHLRKINDTEIEEIRNIINDRKNHMKILALHIEDRSKLICPECGSDDVFKADGDWYCEMCGMIDVLW